MIRSMTMAALFVMLVLYAPDSSGSGFELAPLKLYFSPQANTAKLTITNPGEQAVTVQLSAVSWSQDDGGADVYAPTPDLVFFPKIAQIAPNQERTIRVGYQGGPVTSTEKSYRLYAQELPVDTPGQTAMKFTLRMGVPVFVRSNHHETKWVLRDATVLGDGLQISIGNTGGQHVMVDEVSVVGKSFSGDEVFSSSDRGWYVLADHDRGFKLKLDKEACAAASTLEISATVGDSSKQQQLDVSPGICSELQLSGKSTGTFR